MVACSIENCKKKTHVRNLCNMHYARFVRHGSPLTILKERHNKSNSPEHQAWLNMKARCYNKKNPRFNHYGGRGIEVCDRWRRSFTSFYKDMGDRPTPKHSIDRIDNNGNYEPANCRWATNSQQNYNKQLSARNKSGRKGVRYYKAYGKWVAYITVNYKSIFLGNYTTYKEACKAREEAEVKYIT